MTNIPQHRIVNFSNIGISLRRYSDKTDSDSPITYTHQDDYYIFGFIENGVCCVNVDFEQFTLVKGNAFAMLPGQVHTFVSSTDLSAYMLIVDGIFIEDAVRQILEQNLLFKQPILIDEHNFDVLNNLFRLLSSYTCGSADDISVSIIKHVALSIVGIISECILGNVSFENVSKFRYVEHTVRFFEILRSNINDSHSPSFYAEKLHLSLSYLNESVKAVTGISVCKTIQNEVVLRAKRALVYTEKSIKEIALELGFDDYAYFTRIFKRNVGMNPNSFRKNHK